MISKCHQAPIRIGNDGTLICTVCNNFCEIYTQKDRPLWGKDGLPPHGPSDTSVEAAQSMKGKTSTIRNRVYQFIASKKDYGAIDDEIMVALNLKSNTEIPRRRELEKLGLIVRTEKRRKTQAGRNAIVFVAL